MDGNAIHLEYTPPGGATWLGEAGGQPTQVDACLELRHAGATLGFVLFEVKYTEAEFGTCRGWNGKRLDGAWLNADRTRCDRVLAETPGNGCWLVEQYGRTYWDRMLAPRSSFRIRDAAAGHGCPFRGGLYQLMRNRVLADALVVETPARWADVIVCAHPGNDVVFELRDGLADTRNALSAFDEVSTNGAVRAIDANAMFRSILGATGESAWADWMSGRYGLQLA